MSRRLVFITTAFFLDFFITPIWFSWLSFLSFTFLAISFLVFFDKKNLNRIILYTIILIFYSILNSFHMIIYLLSSFASIGTAYLLEKKIIQLDNNIKGGVAFSLISLGLLYAYLNIIINYL